MTIHTVNPSTGRVLQEHQELSADEVRAAIERARAAFLAWRDVKLGERARLLHEAAGVLRARASEYAGLMAREMGKPVREGRKEAEKCAWVCEHYAEHGEAYLATQRSEAGADATRAYVVHRPLGVLLAIMPWNFPFWQVLRFGAPALMAGNAILLKHAPNVPGCALAIDDALRRAGFPRDVLQALIVGVDKVPLIIEHPHVRGVTFTGSVSAGRTVAEQAGAQGKKTVLELGGADPYLVLEDADLERAAEVCVRSRLINSGQSCIAAKRFVVVRAVLERFQELVVERMRAARVGDPFDEDTDVGPLAREDLRERLHQQVTHSIARGARCLLGGVLPSDEPGCFYPPTVLTGVGPGMPAYEEELFGPVAAIVPVDGEQEAVRVANDSRYGLGAAVFTRDVARGELIAAEKLEAGCCAVNDMVRSDPRLPFGGVKDSGYGKELGRQGILEFVNAKAVVVA